MDLYLINYHEDDIINIMNITDDLIHSSINVSLTQLQQINSNLYDKLIANIYFETIEWEKCILDIQNDLVKKNSIFLEPGYQLKENIHVRFVNLPVTNVKQKFPSIEQLYNLVQIKGNVIRRTPARTLEYKKAYICSKCKVETVVEGKYNKFYALDPPRTCINLSNGCKGFPQQKQLLPNPEFCMDYQELRVQEQFSERVVSSTLLVTLENDLVDSCVPGDCVTVCGIIERRSPPLVVGQMLKELTLTLRATSVLREESKANIGKDLPEQMIFVQAHWAKTSSELGELNARDLIIRSIAPDIYGMYYVKLAIALSLCSCIERLGTETRENSHLFLVGDPGLAKSKLLKAASQIAIRSVHTTGMGCSKAGLTAAVIKDEGDWQLEAGALVLADGGICCLDEFGLMRESDKSSIHEAMEQQTISMAKAGVVCRLSTRCVVIAATNPKPIFKMSEPEGTCSANIGVGAPLLSRFDLVFILKDEQSLEWDKKITKYILRYNTVGRQIFKDVWNLEQLQAHFLAIKDIRPEITNEANSILGAYYRACRSDPMRDISRTSARLLDSLVRLAQSHARLVFRNIVSIEDAVLIVQLMESSFGFGRILKPLDLIKSECPLGPSNDDVRHVLQVFKLNDLNLNREILPVPEKPTTERQFEIEDSEEENLDEILNYDFENCVPENTKTSEKRKTTEEIQGPFNFSKRISKQQNINCTSTQSISGIYEDQEANEFPRTFSQIITSDVIYTQELCLTGNTPEININDIFDNSSSSSDDESSHTMIVSVDVLREDVEMIEQNAEIRKETTVAGNIDSEPKECKISEKTLAKLNFFKNIKNVEPEKEPIAEIPTKEDEIHKPNSANETVNPVNVTKTIKIYKQADLFDNSDSDLDCLDYDFDN